MPAKPPSVEHLRRVLKASREHPTATAAAASLGMPRQTFQGQLLKALALPPESASPEPVFEPIPDDAEDTHELIVRLAERAQKRKARWKAEKWRRIRLKAGGPVAVAMFTDVHLDDPGCDHDTLLRHVNIVKNTPFAYGLFAGDAHNNWPTDGRLAKKWADQETSKKQAYQLVDWFLKDSVKWLAWVVGNHDAWSDGEFLLRQMNADLIPMHDWRAQFVLEVDGRETKLDVAHNFKGHSMWNDLHAEGKEAQMGEGAHLYFSGHRHVWGLAKAEYARRGLVTWLMRAKGYKENDEYAHRGQFPGQEEGHAGVIIINPKTPHSNPIVHATMDVAEGMDYLTFLRSKC